MIDKNVEYYNKNADAFFQGSVGADISFTRNRFIALLPERGHVLDAGCRPGREDEMWINVIGRK